MRNYLVRAVAILAVGAGTSLAQGGGLTTSKCAGGAPLTQQQISQDACQQAYDVYQFLAPQLGISLAGGNATIGQGSVLGGIGHLSVGVRGNVIKGVIPDIGAAGFTQGTSGAQHQTLPTKSTVVGLPTADAAVGIFKGFPLALTNILGLDALVSAAYVPTITQDNVSITPTSNWQFGWGARVGLLSESIVVPGVSVTWIERDLPETTLLGTSNTGGGHNTLEVDNFKVKTSAWRVVASKSFIVFGLAGGVGQDKYDQSSTIKGTVSQGVFSGTQSIDGKLPTMTRTNYFADLSLNLPIFKFVVEGGMVSGGSAPTYNSFKDGNADRSLTYGSAGIRLSW